MPPKKSKASSSKKSSPKKQNAFPHSSLTKGAPERLAALREVAGAWLTQKKLAELCGCSRVTIRSVENRERKLTLDLAGKIGIATGACAFWLTYGICQAKFMETGVLQTAKSNSQTLVALQSEVPLCPNGDLFTYETFQQRKAISGKQAPGEVRASELLLADQMALVLRAAAGSQKLPAVIFAINSAIRDSVENFELGKGVLLESKEAKDGLGLDAAEIAALKCLFPVGEIFALRDAVRRRSVAQYREDTLDKLEMAAGVIKVITDRLLDPAGDHMHLGEAIGDIIAEGQSGVKKRK